MPVSVEKKSTGGLVHLYVGDGKGKTTAAVGLAVRFLGRGKRVLFCQFLKGRETGEIEPLTRLGAQVLRAKAGGKFVSQMSEEELCQVRKTHAEALEQARRAAADGACDLLVLDEVVDAVNCKVVEQEDLLALLRERAQGVEVVLSGRNPPDAIAAAVDYHTDFVCRRHPYHDGVPARPCVEF